MSAKERAAAWRTAWVFLAGIGAEILMALVNDQQAFSGIMAGRLDSEFWLGILRIAIAAGFMGILKYSGFKVPVSQKFSIPPAPKNQP
jgi:spore maturation protein SpmA